MGGIFLGPPGPPPPPDENPEDERNPVSIPKSNAEELFPMRLDNRLVEALEGIADGLPLPGGLQKYILKEAN